MVERRWLLRLVPPVVGAVAVGLIAATSIGATGATDAAWDPPGCPGGTPTLVEAVRMAAPDGPEDLADEAWFTLDPRLDAAGLLVGQRLRIGTHGADRAAFLELPPETAAAGPFGRVVLVAADDGSASVVRAVDRRAGCAWPIATSPDVVRRVTLDPTGTAVYEYRLDRRSRADLGVWRRALDGGPATRVLPPLPADRAVGMTFSTSLSWSAEGDRLAVQQCGAVRCRTRLLDPVTGTATTVAAPDQGELLGVAAGRVVTYATCPGLPCPIIATDIAGGRWTVLHERAALARLIATAAGPRVALEAADDPWGAIRVVRLDGTPDVAIPRSRADLRLMPAPERAAAGIRVPPGWLIVSPDGRSPVAAIVTRLADGASVDLRQVTP